MEKNILFSVLFLTSLMISSLASAGEWDKARDLDVDKEIADMSAASTILPPGQHENSNMNPDQGKIAGLSPNDSPLAAQAAGEGVSGAGAGLGTANTNAENSQNFLDANLNVSADEGISPDAGTAVIEEAPTVGVDVSGEENYLINADATVGDTTVSAALIPSDSLEGTLVGEMVDVGAEVDAGGDLSGSEVDIGIEADVDGSVLGDDISADPAEELSSTPLL